MLLKVLQLQYAKSINAKENCSLLLTYNKPTKEILIYKVSVIRILFFTRQHLLLFNEMKYKIKM